MTMKVYVDGEPLTGAGTTLAAALESVRAGLGGRLVIEALADGQAVPPEHFDDPPGADPYAARLDIRTEDAGALVRFSFLEAADALERSRPDQMKAAEMIQTGDTVGCMAQLGPVLETWSAAAQTLAIARQLDEIGLPAQTPAGRSIDDATTSLNAMLVEVKRCLAGDDPSGLADVLAYDMTAATDDWVEMLRALAGSLGGVGSRG